MADDVKKPGAEVKNGKILEKTKHHKINIKKYIITKLVHNFSDLNTVFLKYDSVQAGSNFIPPKSYSAKKTRQSPTQNDKVTYKNNIPSVHVGNPRKSE